MNRYIGRSLIRTAQNELSCFLDDITIKIYLKTWIIDVCGSQSDRLTANHCVTLLDVSTRGV